jgi:hypothetical protein
MSDFQCRLSADLLRRVAMITSDESARYYLNGVHVEAHPDGGAILVATDGRKMVCLHDADAMVVNGPAIISLSAPMRRPKSKRKAEADCDDWYVCKNGRAAIVRLNRKRPGEWPWDPVTFPGREVIAYQWDGTLIDGTYPDWRNVLRGLSPNEALPIACFNPALLGPLAASLIGSDKIAAKGVRLVATGGDNHPVLVFHRTAPGFGVIMPIRDEPVKCVLPAWLKTAPDIDAELAQRDLEGGI